jgi:lipopolysaccharide/colanic/teichoic acid biosynthesis glycosyltransferase
MTNGIHAWQPERLLIVGSATLGVQIITETESRRSHSVVVGVIDDDVEPATPQPRGRIVAPFARMSEIVDEVRPDRVLLALGERRRRTPVRALVESCVARGVVVEDASEYLERLRGKLAIESLTPASLVLSKRFGPSRAHHWLARVMSLIAAVAGLVLLMPLFAAVAIAIKIDSAGPVVFRQLRVGVRGRPFTLLKFRTMREAAGRSSEWERDNRDRVTRVGRWLRAFRLDELPQFVNVLRGEMNLVGPRPHPVSNYEIFTLVARNMNEITGSAIGYYTLRSMVAPGITGWAQVRYRYANNLDEEIEKLRYDLYYVKHASLALDLRVLAETVKVMLAGRPEGRRREALVTPQAGTPDRVAIPRQVGRARVA